MTIDKVLVRRIPFDLDCVVINLILIPEQLCDLFEALSWFVGSYVRSQCNLLNGETPNVEVVDLLHVFDFDNIPVNRLDVNALRRSFEQDMNAISHDRYSSNEDKTSEDEGTNRISLVPGRLEIDDDGGSDDTDTLNHIPEEMDDGSAYVYIFFTFASIYRIVDDYFSFGIVGVIVLRLLTWGSC